MDGLPDVPRTIAALKRDRRGYPIPWFVATPGAGQPIDFRVMDDAKAIRAIKQRLCWVCGTTMGSNLAFVGGPLSTAQRLYTDLPMHVSCAEFSMKVCPFIAIPSAHRRTANMPDKLVEAIQKQDQQSTGFSQENPTVFGMLVSNGYKVADGAFLANPPERIEWFCRGRKATGPEVIAAIEMAKKHPDLANNAARHILAAIAKLPIPEEQ